jgi:hypothetical protein
MARPECASVAATCPRRGQLVLDDPYSQLGAGEGAAQWPPLPLDSVL